MVKLMCEPTKYIFSFVFGSMGFLQLEDEKIHELKKSVSVFLGFFRSKQGIRIGESLNCD